jgi:hypothetical protein
MEFAGTAPATGLMTPTMKVGVFFLGYKYGYDLRRNLYNASDFYCQCFFRRACAFGRHH